MNKVYLLTGGNVGNRGEYLQESVRLIGAGHGCITQRSSVYETAAWGKTDQGAFLNQALEWSTELQPAAAMTYLLGIEEALGRKRLEKYGPRTIDIDMLLFGDTIMDTPLLTLPHPQMAMRRFVLRPLTDIAAQCIHPILNKTIACLLEICPDPLPVKKFSMV